MADYNNGGSLSNGGNTKGSGGGISIFTIVFIIVGAVALYYLYKYMYNDVSNKKVAVFEGKKSADEKMAPVTTIPRPFEGGEYSFTSWIYVNSFNKGYNRRKHIFELHGKNFSTLLVGLGAYKNTLVVRTHTASATGEGFEGTMHKNLKMDAPVAEGFQTSTPPPAGRLNTEDVTSLFGTIASDGDAAICDLPEIDLQRWVMVTVVLSGRTIDVYLDGKLARSCVSSSYYKVDAASDITAVVLDKGGFDGYVSNMAVSNYAMNPDEIYRAYLAGPEGSGSYNLLSWFRSLFSTKA